MQSNHEAASHTPARTPTWNPGRRPTLFLSTSLGRSRMANRSWCGTPRASPSLNSGGLSVCPSARRRRSSAEALAARFSSISVRLETLFSFGEGQLCAPRDNPQGSSAVCSARFSICLSIYVSIDLRVDPAGYLDRLTESWQKPPEGSRSTVRVSIVVGCG